MSIASCAARSARPTCSSFRSSRSRTSRPRPRKSGIRCACRWWAVRSRDRTIRTRWSRRGPSIPTSTAISFPRYGTSGSPATIGKVLVNFCETLVVQHMGMPSQLCIHAEVCGKGVAIEHDGSVYACDHYVYPEYRLGNVREKSLGDMVFSPTQVKFAYAKSDTLPAYCRTCEFLRDCWGECPKNRLLRTPDGEPGLNYLCPGFEAILRARGADRGETGGANACRAAVAATTDVSHAFAYRLACRPTSLRTHEVRPRPTIRQPETSSRRCGLLRMSWTRHRRPRGAISTLPREAANANPASYRTAGRGERPCDVSAQRVDCRDSGGCYAFYSHGSGGHRAGNRATERCGGTRAPRA